MFTRRWCIIWGVALSSLRSRLTWLGGGLGAMTAVTVLVQLPRLFGAGLIVTVLLAVLATALLLPIGMNLGRNTWTSVIGLVVMVVPPFAGLGAINSPLLGEVAVGSVANASAAWWPSGYRFTDGTLRLDLAQQHLTVSYSRQQGERFTTAIVAPVVPQGWTPGEPVRVWAVARGSSPPAAWARPFHAGVRLLTLDSDYEKAADDAIVSSRQRLGVVSSAHYVLIRWVADPARERRAAWLALLKIVTIVGGCWSVLVLCLGVRIKR
jgi:hypothetical protein